MIHDPLKLCLAIATAQIGVKEVPGDGNNPSIIEYHKSTALKATSDDIPWCASFVNWVLNKAGLKGTGSAAARSFLKWGAPLDAPVPGCIVVLRRGTDVRSGHVGFYTGRKPNGLIKVLGGNQNDSVRVSVYQEKDVLPGGYRWI